MAEIPFALRSWLVVEPGSELKMCPQCGSLALEGEVECLRCGHHPTDDSSWRGAGRLPLSTPNPMEAMTGRKGTPIFTGQTTDTGTTLEEKSKIDQIWDLILSLNEEEASGMIDYRKVAEGTGRLTVTLDGRRISVYIGTNN